MLKFLERNNFCIVPGESPETMRKLFLSTKFSHQKIRWNYGIFSIVKMEKWLSVKSATLLKNEKQNIYRCFFAFSLFAQSVLFIHLKSCFLERKVTTSTFSHVKLTRDLSRQRFFRTSRSSLSQLCSKLDGCLWRRRIITQLPH